MWEHDNTRDLAPEALVDQDSALHYEVRVKGHLDARWSAWFDGLTLANESDGTTTIHGPIVDQAALHGLLQKLRDAGMSLVSVTQVRIHEGR
jgi:hypothetical protein